jgi:hypothetical protein
VTSYPDNPGFKEGETSRDAALRFGLNASTLRDRTYQYTCHHPQQRADQMRSRPERKPVGGEAPCIRAAEDGDDHQ